MAIPSKVATDRADGPGSPLRRQYEALRSQHPRCVLLFQLGDFFEAFEEDARTVAQVCGVTLTSREFGKGDRVLLAGVPVSRLDYYLGRLIEAGVHVAIAEQVSPPGAGLVERVVTRVVTPGTLAEPMLVREKENNYLAAIIRGRGQIGLAYVDVTTGEFATTQLEGDDLEARLRAELERLDPSEVLLPEGQERERPGIGFATVCPDWRFSEAAARDRLGAHFGVLSLEGFGCAGLPLAVRAAGAIVAYLEEHNRRLLANLLDLRTYSTTAGMLLDSDSRRNLELLRRGRTGRTDGSLIATLDRTRTPMGGRLLRRWINQPLLSHSEIQSRLDAVETLVQLADLRWQIRRFLGQVGDLERQVGRVVQGVASARELLDLAASLRAAASLADQLGALRGPTGARYDLASPAGGIEMADAPGVASEAVERLLRVAGWQTLDAGREVADLIERGVAPPESGRLIRAGYSPELDQLVAALESARRRVTALEQTERERTGIKSLRVGYNKVFGYYLEVTRPNLAHVPADYQRKQTLVQAERFVTDALKSWELEILQTEEQREVLEQSVFDQLRREVARDAPRLRTLATALARLDVLAAFADLAHERAYCRPEIDEGLVLDLREARHPVVETSLDPGTFIPNDCRLDAEGSAVMILTGPNMAGKSTYLRQVALIVLLAHLGSFVPARQARIGLVDRIFTRVGAQDDLTAGASTFMVEMMETASILRHATRRSLIILDEIGRGTSTFDGLAIARAVVEEIHDRIGARTLFATHFHELATWAAERPGVQVANVAVAEENGSVIFLRRIRPGVADRSFGIHVARLAGLPRHVTSRAEVILQELEASVSGRASAAAAPVQLPLHGLGVAGDPLAELLKELLSLDLQAITPLEALEMLWRLQQRAGRR